MSPHYTSVIHMLYKHHMQNCSHLQALEEGMAIHSSILAW